MTKKGTYKVTAEDGKGCIYITGYIGGWDLERFEAMVNALVAQGITDAAIHLDSFGGDAFSAQRIGNVIARFKGEVSCHVGLVAASSASYVLAKCSVRTIAQNGQIMFHKPSIHEGGNVDEVTASLKMLKNITKDFAKVYAEVMAKTEAEVEAMWITDYWMDAEEALSLGFVTEIGEPIETPDSLVVAELQSAGRWAEPKVTAATTPEIDKTQNTDMKNQPLVLAALNLPENSDDAAVLSAVNKLVSANTKMAADLKKLQDDAAAQKAAQVTALVDGAVKSNKITEAERDRYTKLATADYENTALVLNDKVPHVTASSKLGGTGAPVATSDKYSDWDYEKLSKEAPKVLAQIKVNEPERFAKLREEYVKA